MNTFTSLDEFGFHQILALTPGIALVMFTGEGCSSCRAWKQLLESFQAAHKEIKLFEVDAGHAQALAHEFSVYHLPALFLYRDGQFHAGVHCEARQNALKATIANLLSGEPQDPP